MLYVGIDLAWKERNPSGLAVINQSGVIVHSSCAAYSDEDFASFLIGLDDDVVLSVDSPLQVKNEKGGRACDSQLMKHRFHSRTVKVFATSRSYMNRHYNGVRGEDLLALLENRCGLALGQSIVETFPTGIVLSLFPDLADRKYKLSSRQPLSELKKNCKALIDSLKSSGFSGSFPDPADVESRKEYKEIEDEIDGILCAVNSYYFSHYKSFSQFGTGENGLTIIAEPLSS